MSSDEWVVTMPKLGETVTEGTVGNWLKQVGDTVAFDDPLFEVSTDKVDSEIPSPYDGVIARDPGAGGRDRAGRHPAGADRRARRPPRAPGAARLPSAAHQLAAAGGPALGDPAAPQMGGSEGPAERGHRARRAGRRRARHHHAEARARPSPRARSAPGSSRSATRSSSTTRCSRCPPTRSTRRSPARTTACCWRSWSPRARPCRSAPRWPASASPARCPAAGAASARRPRRRTAAAPARGSGGRRAAAASADGDGRCSRRSSAGSPPRTGWTGERSPAPARRPDPARGRGEGDRQRRRRGCRTRPGRGPGGRGSRDHPAPAARPGRGRGGRAGRWSTRATRSSAAVPDAAGGRRRHEGLADASAPRVDLRRGRLRQRRQGAGASTRTGSRRRPARRCRTCRSSPGR